MCTVTFVPVKNGVLLTSNRDEWHTRKTALAPGRYGNTSQTLLYPMDKDAGGSWIATNNNGDAAVLLNGAFVPHVRMKTYRQSRGLVLLEIMNDTAPLDCLNRASFEGIEPFTLVLYTNARLHEFRWDGNNKNLRRLHEKQPHIWSSVTLYDEAGRQKRENWFREWQRNAANPGMNEVIQFHHTAGEGNPHDALVMDRGGKIATVSITSIYLSPTKAKMIHYDIREDKQYTGELALRPGKTVVDAIRGSRAFIKVKSWLIRCSHWEYWPFDLVYLPVYVYWIWLSLRARSFFFFSAANPRIQNAGFVMEKKKEIYDLMPQEYYPVTILCPVNSPVELLQQWMDKKNLRYPLIAKPNIGQRGMQVKLIRSYRELKDYHSCTRVDFLLQEFIPYKNEAGIFYYRMPGEQSGHITGIVGKEFLAVTGDGHSTIEQLLMKEKRYFLQLQVLKRTQGGIMKEILPAGERRELVPYGNHSRGAKFLDLTHLVTPDLVSVIDKICQSIPGFYYGRMDIRFSNWEDLCRGVNFSIIELNGAGSEPTHIYDPKHSIFFAWKEIIRHLQILYRISRANARLHGIKLMSTSEGVSMLAENRKYLKKLMHMG